VKKTLECWWRGLRFFVLDGDMYVLASVTYLGGGGGEFFEGVTRINSSWIRSSKCVDRGVVRQNF